MAISNHSVFSVDDHNHVHQDNYTVSVFGRHSYRERKQLELSQLAKAVKNKTGQSVTEISTSSFNQSKLASALQNKYENVIILV